MAQSLNEAYDKIYRYCYFRVHNRETAEDLTQETFLSYFSQHTYENRGKQLAYLYTIARNACISYYRRKKETPLDTDIAAPDIIEKSDYSLSVRQAVGKLDPEARELIFLRYGIELGMAEIAGILHISRFALRRRLNTILEVLKKELD